MALTARSVAGKRVCSGRALARGGARAGAVSVSARSAPWSPGSEAPAYLDGSLPGDFGFDPLGLGKNPASLARFREAEVIHARWCMLGTAGILAQELSGQGLWLDAPKWALTGEHAMYLGKDLGPTTLVNTVIVQAVLMGLAEGYRGKEADPIKRVYPGGAFDPLGMANETMKLKEIKNGRLAMFSIFGYFMQTAVTGDGPITCWQKHLADPWGVNVATNNSVAVPYLHPESVGTAAGAYWQSALPAWYPGL